MKGAGVLKRGIIARDEKLVDSAAKITRLEEEIVKKNAELLEARIEILDLTGEIARLKQKLALFSPPPSPSTPFPQETEVAHNAYLFDTDFVEEEGEICEKWHASLNVGTPKGPEWSCDEGDMSRD